MTATDSSQTAFRTFILGGDANALWDVPAEDAFEVEVEPDPNVPDFDPDADPAVEQLDYIPAEDLQRICNALVRGREEFEPIRRLAIVCLWKREGGVEDGRPLIGDLKRPRGLERQLTEHLDEHGRRADFVLFLAADNLRGTLLPAWKLERHIYHQLCHADIHPKTGSPRRRPHDYAGFVSEIGDYGLPTPELERMGAAVQQMPLFGANGNGSAE